MAVSPDIWSVKAARRTVLGNAELRHYDFPTPSDVVEDEGLPILSLTLSGAKGGDGRARFVDAPGTHRDLGPVVLRPAAMPLHAYGIGGPSDILICEYDHASFEQLTGLSDWDRERLRQCVDVRSDAIDAVLARLAQELLQPGFASEMLVELLLQTLLIDLGRVFRSAAADVKVDLPKGGLSGWQLRRIRDLLYDSSGEWPSISTLAEACGISRCHLSRSFRQATGSTLAQYSSLVRTQRAKALLGREDMRITDVAVHVGFGSVSSFSTAFRRETGLSPAAFVRARSSAISRMASGRHATVANRSRPSEVSDPA
jgi:AraC family transcriptional regulator